jgi:hypothetical protein
MTGGSVGWIGIVGVSPLVVPACWKPESVSETTECDVKDPT